MASIKTMHDGFLHDLGDAYDAEEQLLAAMQEMLTLAQSPEVKRGLQQHITDTKAQIKNLDAVFKSLGEPAKKEACKGAAGIISENKTALKSIKQPALIDCALADGGLKAEHYEIASYRSLVSKARLMGHNQAATLLQQNLQMEEQFAQQLEQVGQKLGQQLIGQGKEIVGHEITGRMPDMSGTQSSVSTH
jgi:ferritin-like metal-binding protein YciE